MYGIKDVKYLKKNEMKKLQKIRLDNLGQIKRFYARLINDLNNELVTENKAKTLTYMLNSYANIFANYELESRVNELEKLLKEINK